MKVLILGHQGMLGSACVKHFSNKHSVITVDQRLTKDNSSAFVSHVLRYHPDVVINCLGQIKQKYNDREEMFFINGAFPKMISESISRHQLLVQPSTDCIFSGKKGTYSLTDTPDPIDDYGLSKLLGENLDVDSSLVIRTSIIGIENQTHHSLLSWFLTQKNVKGYTNHYWSGITTLEWCKSIEKLVDKDSRGVNHLSTEKISKCDLLTLVKNSFNHDCNITPTQCDVQIDRSLVDSSLKLPELKDQLDELSGWHMRVS